MKKEKEKRKKVMIVVGYGIFGKLLADFLSRDFEVWVYDIKKLTRKDIIVKFGGKKKNIHILSTENYAKIFWDQSQETFSELKKKKDKNLREKKSTEKIKNTYKSYIIFSVPVAFVQESAQTLKKKFPYIFMKESVVLDVSSVKMYPLKILKKEFPKHEVVGTHPMFGVPSIEQNIPNLKVVITNISGKKKTLTEIKKYIKSLSLTVLEMEARDHDKRMAKVQALTHFTGEALKNFDLVDDSLKTLSYRHLYALHVDTALNTKELFETIQRYNPYAKSIRKKMIGILTKIDNDLEK